MTNEPLHTPLFDWHAAHDGRLVDFAGWSMPVQYGSIVAEHQATRTAVGLFDISHMGRLRFTGSAVPEFLNRLVTRRVVKLNQGLIRYALITNEQGGILDDVLVYHLAANDGTSRWMMVVNAGNRAKIVSWIGTQLESGTDVQCEDLTLQTAMIAVQGPKAIDLVSPLLGVDLASFRYYSGQIVDLDGHEVIVSRTGYTGEDGCELIVPAANALDLWKRILADGRAVGGVPVGLGARDTLRLEAAMPLYGHELTESIHPFQAGLDFAVQLKDHEFIGRAALVAAKADPSWPRRVGLRIAGRRVAREHALVLDDGQTVGEITSGTFSPTMQQTIAMAYVPLRYSQPGTELHVDIRGRQVAAQVVDLPFYSRLF